MFLSPPLHKSWKGTLIWSIPLPWTTKDHKRKQRKGRSCCRDVHTFRSTPERRPPAGSCAAPGPGWCPQLPGWCSPHPGPPQPPTGTGGSTGSCGWSTSRPGHRSWVRSDLAATGLLFLRSVPVPAGVRGGWMEFWSDWERWKFFFLFVVFCVFCSARWRAFLRWLGRARCCPWYLSNTRARARTRIHNHNAPAWKHLNGAGQL